MAFSDRLEAMRDWFRHKWMYRKDDGGGAQGAAAAGRAQDGDRAPSSSRSWLGWLKPVIILIPLAIVLYYGVGMAIVQNVDDNPDFTVAESDIPQGGSKAVAVAAALVDREVNQHSWTANDPFFQPGWALDNMPNFQQGIVTALARFSFELMDQLGRLRGSSEADPDLAAANGRLQYPGDVWLWNPSKSLALKSSSESQYREAREHLLAYNRRLAKGDGRTRSDPGKQYGSGGRMQDTRYMLSVTSNAPETAFGDVGQTLFSGRSIDDLLSPVHINFAFFGASACPTFAAYDVSKGGRTAEDFRRYEDHLIAVYEQLAA